MTAAPVVLAWSGGKDCALALARLLDDPRVDVVALLTTMLEAEARVNVHGVRDALLRRQAAAVGIDLLEVGLPAGASNDVYEQRMRDALDRLRATEPQLGHVVFGDIFLADVRAYREQLVHACGLAAHFPLWGEATADLALEVIDRGIAARIVCVDTTALPATFAGVPFDRALLAALPAGVDPCGERGEFHTFVHDAPFLRQPVAHETGSVLLRDGRFAWCDLLPPGPP